MHLYTKFLAQEINCPYCRDTYFKKRYIIKLWKKWIIINYNNDIFSKNTILNINNNLKLNNINFILQYDININNILLPLFHGKPVFLVTPIINDSNVLYNDKVIQLSHLFIKI